MSWLARLKENKNAPDTKPTKPAKGAFVGFVGACPDPFQKSNMESDALKKWQAANDAESDGGASARLTLFMDRGLNTEEAEAMVDRLALRDEQHDERRLCLECLHLSGGVNGRRCAQWRKIGLISGAAIPGELVTLLQRCVGFNKQGRV